MSAFEFVRVTSDADITEVARLAKDIWTECYTPLEGEKQVEYMLTNCQSVKAIKATIGEGYRYRYYLIRRAGQNVGYFAFTIENGGLFLSKLYLIKDERRKGCAEQVIEYFKHYCEKYDLFKIWLSVNRHNTDAIAAYEALGFKKAYDQVLDTGDGFVLDDCVMIKNV